MKKPAPSGSEHLGRPSQARREGERALSFFRGLHGALTIVTADPASSWLEFKANIAVLQLARESSVSFPVLSLQCSYHVWCYTAYLKMCLAGEFSALSLKFQLKFSFFLFFQFLAQFEDYICISPWENARTLPKNP